MISTRDMRVDYDDFTAVHDLTLKIPAGRVFGLIGPNGAGKTSTIRVLATLQEPTYGEVSVGGYDVAEQPEQVHRILGFMPDLSPVHDDLKVWEFLDLFAGAHFIDRRERRKRVAACLEMVELQNKRDVKAGTLSRGMMQRCVLAKTLLHEPKVLLLDEPASGVDPIARIEFRRIIRRLAEEGRTVLVSSHILIELADICDMIGIMQQGQMVVQGRIDEIIQRIQPGRQVEIDCPGAAESAAQMLRARPGVTDIKVEGKRLLVEFDGDEHALGNLLTYLVGSGIVVTRFVEKRLGVEEIMLKVGAKEVS